MITRMITLKVCFKHRTFLPQDCLLKTRQPQLHFRQSLNKSVILQYSRSRRDDSYSANQKITQHFIKHESSLPHSHRTNTDPYRSHIQALPQPSAAFL